MNEQELKDNLIKQKIIDLFNTNVKGKKYIHTINKHCGSEGHWLEKQMGIKHNNKNEPDIEGYEMKKAASKITFGDFSASEYLFTKRKKIIDSRFTITRNEFIRYFGTPNPLKNNRYSWSGSCVPVYGKWNDCGQIMVFDEELNLCIYYDYTRDTRDTRDTRYLKDDKILIAIWTYKKLEKHINSKFNKRGFFICKKTELGIYDEIVFGKSFDIDYFIENIKNGTIIFDSGMYEGNSRNYSQFRSTSKKFWELLLG